MKAIFAAFVVLFAAATLSADAYSTFSSVVKFSDSLKDLVEKPASIDPKVLYLLQGTIRDLRVKKSESGFYAEADFVDSEWQNLDSIKTYKIVIVFAKPQFADVIPERPARNDPTKIAVNTDGLALVQFVRTVPDSKGEMIPVFLVQDYRILK